MKRFLQKAVCLILLFLLALPAKAYASNGSGNMDGGGSGMGQLPPTTGHLDMMESGSLWWMHPPALLSVPQWTFPTKPLTNRWSTLPKRINFSIWPVLPLNLPVVLMYIRFQLLPCPIL